MGRKRERLLERWEDLVKRNMMIRFCSQLSRSVRDVDLRVRVERTEGCLVSPVLCLRDWKTVWKTGMGKLCNLFQVNFFKGKSKNWLFMG